MYSKISLVVLSIVLINVGKGSWDISQKARVAETERGIAEKDLADKQNRNAELHTSLERLKSTQGVEAEVRQKYSVALPAEELVVVVDDASKKGENGDATNTQSIWSHFISFFGF